jgi:hypothetical protein
VNIAALSRFYLDLAQTTVPGCGAQTTVLNPYKQPVVREIVATMIKRFYEGGAARLSVWGINPGRLGAGITGIPFVDPVSLQHTLGIQSTITGASEASATFIAKVIQQSGGAPAFYSSVYLSALCPLGLTRAGNNVNFYDDPQWIDAVVPFIRSAVLTQVACGLRADLCVVLGMGKLRAFIERHTTDWWPFAQTVYLYHPRFIMQYKRSSMQQYIDQYRETFCR